MNLHRLPVGAKVLGLAALSTVSLHYTQERAAEIGPELAAATGGQLDPSALAQLTQLGAFTDGATMAFLVGGLMMLAASVIVWVFLDVGHEELATDAPPEGVHVG